MISDLIIIKFNLILLPPIYIIFQKIILEISIFCIVYILDQFLY